MARQVIARGEVWVPDRVGRLMRMQEDELSRYQFEVWFEYTRRTMNDIREGAMLTVRNFASDNTVARYSVLEVTGLKPIHYALGEDPRGFPGFVMEAARSASQDWMEQDSESYEDTTVIRCTAIPTNLEIVEYPDGRMEFNHESNIPMIGEEVRLLSTEVTEQVVNRDLDLEHEELMLLGTLTRDPNVRVYLRYEELVKVHFGIFGFTGAGKSNLLSTLVNKILSKQGDPVKVVLFDLMGEYTALLLDQLLKLNHAYLVCLGPRTLPEPVFRYLNGEERVSLPEATRLFARYTLLPKALKPYQDKLEGALGALLEAEKVKVFSYEGNMTVYDLFFGDHPRAPHRRKERREALANRRRELIKEVVSGAGISGDWKQTPLTAALAHRLQTTLSQVLARNENRQFRTDGDFSGVFEILEETIARGDATLQCGISPRHILRLLDDESSPALFIITSHDPHELRTFAHRLGEAAYEHRRLTGRIFPLVSFIFDEADEFVRQEGGAEHESYKRSREIAHTLARRGRKFGLGLGIATQRIRYLDTSIMAQPHTYLVSKLPRKTDREGVAEAFGIPEEMFRQTFTFTPGDWLLLSHDAAGLKAVPIPIRVEDANQRIARFLEEFASAPRTSARSAPARRATQSRLFA
ncbi:MAG: ATP-binding protein [Moorellales bacterium]